MPPIKPDNIVEQPFPSVKSLNSQLPLFSPDSMIHHKDPAPRSYIIVSYTSICRDRRYGVSSAFRVLSPQLLLKKFDHVRDCLQYTLGLTVSQREVTLRLLRLWAYYGQVYPKEAQVTGEPGCAKATYWRTIRVLESRGLIRVINRYVMRPHAQISNLYRLDRLVLLLARYIAEHGSLDCPEWLTPYLTMPGREFWSQIYRVPGDRAGPGPPACEDPGPSRVQAS